MNPKFLNLNHNLTLNPVFGSGQILAAWQFNIAGNIQPPWNSSLANANPSNQSPLGIPAKLKPAKDDVLLLFPPDSSFLNFPKTAGQTASS